MKKTLRTFLNRRTFLYLLGLFVLALGIRLIIDSKLGAAPWDLLCLGLYEKTGISIGTWQIVNNIVMILITKVLFQAKWNFICLIPGVLLGLFIDMLVIIEPFEVMNVYIMLLIGCVLSGLGLAIYMNQGLSSNAIDNFVYTMNHVKKVSSSICKLACDAIPLFVVIVLGIQLQIATVAVYILVPICMQAFIKILNIESVSK